jgi:hypothetical protein
LQAKALSDLEAANKLSIRLSSSSSLLEEDKKMLKSEQHRITDECKVLQNDLQDAIQQRLKTLSKVRELEAENAVFKTKAARAEEDVKMLVPRLLALLVQK